MSKTVMVIASSGIARLVTISGDPTKHGLVPVPEGRIGYTGSHPLMTFSGRTPRVQQSVAETETKKAVKKKPHIPLSPLDLPTTVNAGVAECLSILEEPLESPPVFIEHDEVIPGVKIPKYLPRDSVFITMVEWSLRPGDSRVEAYFIGTNSARKHWFLMECTVDDLSPYETKYLSRRTVAMLEKNQWGLQEAAISLLRCVWQYEKKIWGTPPFFMVSDSGLLDEDITEDIADTVWPDESF